MLLLGPQDDAPDDDVSDENFEVGIMPQIHPNYKTPEQNESARRESPTTWGGVMVQILSRCDGVSRALDETADLTNCILRNPCR